MTRALEDASIVAPLKGQRVTLIAAGKAAAPMASAFLRAWPSGARGGLVAGTVRGDDLGSLEWFAVGHPLPNEHSAAAGRQALAIAGRLTPADVLMVLLSGGASAALAVPVEGLTLADKVGATEVLLRGGVAIGEVNCVRKHLSAIKGGRLAAATAANVVTLAISDVVGPVPDDPAVIGSGPTTADPTRFADALRVADASGVGAAFPAAARAALERGRRGDVAETPKPGDARLERSRVRVIGSRLDAIAGAAATAAARGYHVTIVDQPVVGEARRAGEAHVKEVARIAYDLPRPACIVSAGETTVRVTGSGRGGRNQEFTLGAAHALTRRFETAVLASIGTDGVDGPTDAAGAVVDTTSLDRAAALGLRAGRIIIWRRTTRMPSSTGLTTSSALDQPRRMSVTCRSF